MQQAEKGDSVLVASGNYNFRSDDPEEIISLLSPILRVAGGYSVDDDFTVQNTLKNKTVINGVLPDFAAKLRTRGFISKANAQSESEKNAWQRNSQIRQRKWPHG